MARGAWPATRAWVTFASAGVGDFRFRRRQIETLAECGAELGDTAVNIVEQSEGMGRRSIVGDGGRRQRPEPEYAGGLGAGSAHGDGMARCCSVLAGVSEDLAQARLQASIRLGLAGHGQLAAALGDAETGVGELIVRILVGQYHLAVGVEQEYAGIEAVQQGTGRAGYRRRRGRRIGRPRREALLEPVLAQDVWLQGLQEFFGLRNAVAAVAQE